MLSEVKSVISIQMIHNVNSISLLTQILKAAMYLHSGNVIHRDQKVRVTQLNGLLQVTLFNKMSNLWLSCLSF